jgi:hypothetical protein
MARKSCTADREAAAEPGAHISRLRASRRFAASVRLVRASDGARNQLIKSKVDANPLRSFLFVEELSSQTFGIFRIFGCRSDSSNWG